MAVTADLTTEEGADRLVLAAREAFGAVQILINNVGVFSSTTWRAGSAEDWLRTYDTNVGSAVRMIGRVLADMASAGWGRDQSWGTRALPEGPGAPGGEIMTALNPIPAQPSSTVVHSAGSSSMDSGT